MGLIKSMSAGEVTPETPTPRMGSSIGFGEGAQIGGAIADIGTTALQAGLESKEADRARSEARSLSQQMRSDTLAQQGTLNQFVNQNQAQAEKAFEIQQKFKDLSTRFDSWLDEFKEKISNRQQAQQAVSKAQVAANKSQQVKDAMIQMWGK